MAIEKQVSYEIECDGPCKRKVSLSKPPDDWSRLKIVNAVQQPGAPAKYYVSCLCFECKMKSINILQAAGFKITSVNGQRNEERNGRTVDRS